MRNGDDGGAGRQRDQAGMVVAADAAMITDQNVSSEDHKHASGGGFVAIDSSFGAVVNK